MKLFKVCPGCYRRAESRKHEAKISICCRRVWMYTDNPKELVEQLNLLSGELNTRQALIELCKKLDKCF